MRNHIKTMIAALICALLPNKDLNIPQRILIAVAATMIITKLAEDVSGWLLGCLDKDGKEEPAEKEEERRRSFFQDLMLQCTLPQKRHTIEIETVRRIA